MKVKGLDDKIYSWNPKHNQFNNASSLHERVKNLLIELFPCDVILEEVSLPGTATNQHDMLRCDFFLPSRKLLVEIHGEQHYKYNTFFFQNKLAYYKAKGRDISKRKWADINQFTMIELVYNETEDEWRSRIKKYQ